MRYAARFAIPYARLVALGMAILFAKDSPVALAAESITQSPLPNNYFAAINQSPMPFKAIESADPNAATRPGQLCASSSREASQIRRLLVNFYAVGEIPIPGEIARERKEFSNQLCEAQYIPLGKARYLVHFSGLGVLDTRKKTFAALSTTANDGDSLSESYRISANTSARLYEASASAGGGDYDNYWLLLFHRGDNGAIHISYAALAGGDSGDDRGMPLCARGGNAQADSAAVETTVSRPVLTVLGNGTAAITFSAWTANCRTGSTHHAEQLFTLAHGAVTGPDGRSIEVVPFKVMAMAIVRHY